jgi:hypothetical protein
MRNRTPYATPPGQGVKKDRGETRRARRALARATVQAAVELGVGLELLLPAGRPKGP